MGKEFYRLRSTAELCAYCGISRNAALSGINNKKRPVHKMDRFWKFKLERIDAWVKADGAKEE